MTHHRNTLVNILLLHEFLFYKVKLQNTLPLDGGPLIPPGPPLEPRGPLGGPRLRECMGGGPRLPPLSN